MKKIFLFLIFLSLFISCKVQTTEFLKFESYNAMILGSKIEVTLIPTNQKRKRNVIVKTFYLREYFDKRRITQQKYDEIVNLYKKINVLDSAKNNFIDAPTINIKYKKSDFEKEFSYFGIPGDDEKMYKVTDEILKTAGLKMKYIY